MSFFDELFFIGAVIGAVISPAVAYFVARMDKRWPENENRPELAEIKKK
ncbi:unnamed protein product [Rhodiola kirilowii]